MGYVHCKITYEYVVDYTCYAFTGLLLDATTGLHHGVLLQILLSFTMTFHLWSIMKGGKLN